MGRQATRRELIAGSAAAAAAASIAIRATDAAAATTQGTEAQVLSYALQVERLGVIAYSQVLSTSVLSAPVRAQLEVLMAQEREHVAKLEQILRGLGAPIPQGPSSVGAAQALLARHQVHLSLTDLPTQRDCLRLLIDVESLTEGAYYKAIPQLEQPSLLRVGLEIMGSDSQHWTVLSEIQHGGNVGVSVPYPFVQGSP